MLAQYKTKHIATVMFTWFSLMLTAGRELGMTASWCHLKARSLCGARGEIEMLALCILINMID